MKAKSKKTRGGFTLIEMTVVLLIIAIVTHLAMRQLGLRMDDRRTAAANRQLEQIRDSVFHFDGEGVPRGFLADMGRLVSATNGTLDELWRLPPGVKAFAVLPASEGNLAKDAPKDLKQADVFVPTGWRGPYLRLPVGKSHLADPWGNAFENPDAAGYDRLAVSNGQAVAVAHFGPTALTNDAHRQSVRLAPDKWSSTRLFVKVISRGGESGVSGSVTYKWFGPKEGLVTGGVATGAYGTTVVFSGLTPGVRVVWDSLTKASRLVTIRPGDNQLQIEMP